MTPTNDDPGTSGSDSVISMHEPMMTEMNDPVMLSEDGTPETLPGRSGSDSVQAMHDMLWREHAEPRDGFEPVPFWVSVIFGALLAWGGFYIGSNSADFRRDVFDRSDVKLADGGAVAAAIPDPDPQSLEDYMKIGQQKFQTICAACHQPNGQGNPSQNIPPLDGSEWVVDDKASPARLARIVLYGLSGPIQVKGRTYNGVMPNQGNVFKDYEIASVLTYIRNSWSNKADAGKAPAVTTAVVRAARAKEGARKTNGTQPVSQDELLKLPTSYSDGGTPAADAPKTEAPKSEPPKK
jgi:mono/diheme cytochrome c family protein